VAHLHFFADTQTNAKKCKRATKPTHQDTAKWTENYTTEKKGEVLTAPTQKAGFRVPKTALWLMEV
jgi:hypothetical protein